MNSDKLNELSPSANDLVRRTRAGGTVNVSGLSQKHSRDFISKILFWVSIMDYSDFSGNCPNHSKGNFKVFGKTIYWKIIARGSGRKELVISE